MADNETATSRGYQDETGGQGGTRTLCQDGGEDAQEARRASEEEGEAQQDAQVMSVGNEKCVVIQHNPTKKCRFKGGQKNTGWQEQPPCRFDMQDGQDIFSLC